MATHRLARLQLEHAFRASRFAVDTLTDEEFFWEPVQPCWGVRVTSRGAVHEFPSDADPLVTTIGWRLVHLAVGLSVYRNLTFGDATATWESVPVPTGSDQAVTMLTTEQDAYTAAFAECSDGDLDSLRPTAWGTRLPLWQMVWTTTAEHLHHAAEIGVLRDLLRGRARQDWWPELQDGRLLHAGRP